MARKTSPRTFGERLKAARVEAGLSLATVGRRVGVRYQAVQQWEEDVTVPGTFHVKILDAALGLPASTVHGWLDYSPRFQKYERTVHVTSLFRRAHTRARTLQAA